MFNYDLFTRIICLSEGCVSQQDQDNANAIAESIADIFRTAVASGSFASALSNNQYIQSVLSAEIFHCITVWGTGAKPFFTTIGPAGVQVVASVNSTSTMIHPYYPDWTDSLGTCKNDGNEPFYMKIVPSWYLFDALEECCDEYYSGWNKPLCMNSKGSGMWFVEYITGKCRTDCEEGNGVTCGGLVNPISGDLFVDPKDCCETKLYWRIPDFCEVRMGCDL